jgi:hypothetical protein
VKAKHSLESVEELPHWDTVFNADPLHISARKVKRPDGDKIYDVGYCWDCHHWIPGRTMGQFQEHKCKMRKPYQRKAVTPSPAPVPKNEDDDDEDNESVSAEDKAENQKWDDARDELYHLCKTNTTKWPKEERGKLLGVIQAALQDSDPMLGFRQAVLGLLSAAKPEVQAPAAPVSSTSPAAAPPAPVSVPAEPVASTKPFHQRQVLAAPGGRELR